MKIRLNGKVEQLSEAKPGMVRLHIATNSGSFDPVVTPHVAVNFMPGTVVDVLVCDAFAEDEGQRPRMRTEAVEIVAVDGQDCEFCERDGAGNHADRCPVTYDAAIDRLRDEITSLRDNVDAQVREIENLRAEKRPHSVSINNSDQYAVQVSVRQVISIKDGVVYC